MAINAAVLGVTGYTGQALIRLLHNHPVFNIVKLISTNQQGPYHQMVPEFFDASLPLVQLYDVDQFDGIDIVFLAVPHTKAMAIVSPLMTRYPALKIVDLSADFRLTDPKVYESTYGVSHSASILLAEAVYGVPEQHFSAISNARLCANPGCYATAMILGVLPLVGRVDANAPIVIDAKSGVSGAGKQPKPASMFCEVHDQLSAYATGEHRHSAELVQETGFQNALFSPHLVPMDRGIESAIYIHNPDIGDSVTQWYQDHYRAHPFVTVMDTNTQVSTSLVTGTNHCVIICKPMGDWVVVFSLIDNLMKGASSQAVQNANIMCGLDQTTGLNFK